MQHQDTSLQDDVVHPSFLLSLPLDVLLLIVLFLPKEKKQFAALTATCRKLNTLKHNKPLSSLFLPPKFDYTKIRYKAHVGVKEPYASALSSYGKVLAVSLVGVIGKIKFIDASFGEVIATVEGKNGRYDNLCFTSDDKYLIASTQTSIDVYNATTRQFMHALLRGEDRTSLLMCAIDKGRIVFGNDQTPLTIYHPHDNQCFKLTEKDGCDIKPFSMSASEDGRLLVLLDPEKDGYHARLRILNLMTNEFQLIKPACSNVQNIQISSDNKYLFFVTIEEKDRYNREYLLIQQEIEVGAIASPPLTIKRSKLPIQTPKIFLRDNAISCLLMVLDHTAEMTISLNKGATKREFNAHLVRCCRTIFITREGDRVITISYGNAMDTGGFPESFSRETITIFKFPIAKLDAAPAPVDKPLVWLR